jgi:hypothetical protein
MATMFDSDDFWTRVADDIAKSAYRSMGMSLFVDATEGTLVRLKDSTGQPMGVAPYVGFEELYAGDEVWVEPVGRLTTGSRSAYLAWVVIGKITPASGVHRKLRGLDITLLSGMDIYGSPNSDGVVHSWSIGGASGDATFNNVTVANLTAANVTVASLNTPFSVADSQTSADTPTTTNTATLQDAMSVNMTLPSGTWTVTAICWIDLLHSTSNRVSVAVSIDGNAGSSNSPSAPATTPQYRTCKADHAVGSISGGRTIVLKAQYKALDAGTVTANNPALWALARRTA